MRVDFERLWGAIEDPLWYLEVAPIVKDLAKLHDSNRAEYEVVKERLYDFFELALSTDAISLGSEVGIWDTERKPIDTIVIHDTSNLPGLSLERLSAIELMRLYVPAYANPKEGDAHLTHRKPISSGHARNDRQVFYPYHWMVRESGVPVRLLEDHEVGWQSGDWDINCRSVAICLDGDFDQSVPNEKQMSTAAQLCNIFYPQVQKDRVFGHCEINKKTHCPSRLFLPNEFGAGWKHRILDQMEKT